MNKKLITIISIIAFGFTNHMAEAAENMAIPVSVASVVEKDAVIWDEFPARLEAETRVEIISRVDGVLEKIHFNDGQIVKQGRPLFAIDQYAYRLEVAKTDASLIAAKSQANLASSTFTRAAKLLLAKNISQYDYDKTSNNKILADANVKKMEAELAQAKLKLAYTNITAPITGRINRSNLSIGNFINANSNIVLTTIISLNPIYASFDTDEPNFIKYMQAHDNNIDNMMQIRVAMVDTKTNHQGKIKSFDNEVNPLSGTIRVRAVFANDDHKLIPGMFTRVRLGGGGQAKLVLINERAISTDQNKKFVYVVGDKNKIAYREVSLGATVDGLRVVTKGLNGGEKIVVSGLQRVRPDAIIAPKMLVMDNLAEIKE